jgi:hypothetical protein
MFWGVSHPSCLLNFCWGKAQHCEKFGVLFYMKFEILYDLCFPTFYQTFDLKGFFVHFFVTFILVFHILFEMQWRIVDFSKEFKESRQIFWSTSWKGFLHSWLLFDYFSRYLEMHFWIRFGNYWWLFFFLLNLFMAMDSWKSLNIVLYVFCLHVNWGLVCWISTKKVWYFQLV